MKKIILIVFVGVCGMHSRANAQEQELAQLVLDIEKLAQFKAILQQLYDGYKVLEQGYNKVKDITSGNYNLHEAFLDGLYLVSPQVRQYKRIADIIQGQVMLVGNYKQAFTLFKNANVFSPDELDYISRVYSGLLEESLQNIDALIMVITDGQLRMSDDERIQRIDRIYNDMSSKLSFLQAFNGSTRVLALQRVKESTELNSLQQIEKP